MKHPSAESSEGGLNAAAASRDRGVFVTTHWSVVLAATAQETTRARAALEELCTTYWYPLYAYARRQGQSVHDAQDLTQGFFARLLEKDYLQAASEGKGRFRTFLLIAFKRFMANEWDQQRARKRGGCVTMLPLDTRLAESRYLAEPVSDVSAERIYDRRWALTLLDQAMKQLREEFASVNKMDDFEHLKSCLTAERGAIPYADIAEALNMTEATARVTVHRFRKRFRNVFREIIAQTVDDPQDTEGEMRHLLAAMGG